MNVRIFFFWSLIMIASCDGGKKINKSVDLSSWEFKMISRGENRPSFNTTGDSIQYLPILLHYGHSESDIKQRFNWSEDDYKNNVNTLLQNGFLKKINGRLTPSLMILSEKEATKINSQLKPVSIKVSQEIISLSDSIRSRTEKIPCFYSFDFDEVSLLILSNVLMDNGQIQNIEKEYLKKGRPNRNNNNYYASYQEKVSPSFEALGIYGNHVELDNGFVLCRYGNQRYIPEVLDKHKEILINYRKFDGNQDFDYPVVTAKCNGEIQELANFFKPYLLGILNEYDSSLFKKSYQESSYSKEVSFEEYFIWIYHLLYSQVTDILVDSGHIHLPTEKVSFYIFQPEK